MKFICTQENLVRGISKVAPLAGRNTQLPILNNILLQLRDGVLHATCTDLEVGIHITAPGKVEKEGGCTVPARKFMEYIQQLPPTNPLTLELKKNTLHLTTERFHAQFPTTPDDDYPLLPSPSGNHRLNLKPLPFCRAISRTMFAAARDATRPEIHSVFVSGEGTHINIAATDSFRLAEEILTVPQATDPFSFLLPLNTAQEIARLFGNQADISILPHDNHIAVHGEGIELSSRLVDGKYPDYQQIIPQQFSITGTADRETLVRALKTLLVFLPRDSRRVQFNIQPKQGTLTLAVGGSDAGAGNVTLDFSGEGDDVEVLFNIQYLLDGIQSLPDERCAIKLVGNTDPALFGPTTDDVSYLYVVMPIQA